MQLLNVMSIILVCTRSWKGGKVHLRSSKTDDTTNAGDGSRAD